MPAPLVGAAAIAARLVARKIAKDSAKKAVKKAAKANARGLKAAQKPTNKTGSKADRTQRAELINQSNLIKNASPARANRTRGGSLYAIKTYGGQGLVSAKKTPKQAARQAEITKELNPVRKMSKAKDTNTKVSNPKSAMRVKGAAKPKPNKPDAAKLNYKAESSRGRAGDTAYRNFANDQTPRKADSSVDRFMRFNDEANLEAMIARQEAVLGRKTRIGIQKSMGIKRAKRPKKSK